MNTTATAASLAAAETTTEGHLGWSAMPAYGEVMTELFGVNHLAFDTPATRLPAPAATTSLFLENFWSTVRNQFMAMAA